MAAEKNAPPVSANRQAYHDYFIHETYECGIALTGTEVKIHPRRQGEFKRQFCPCAERRSISLECPYQSV